MNKMSVRQRIIQILRGHNVADPASAIQNFQQSMGFQIGQNDDAEVIAGLVLDTVDYAGAADRAAADVRAAIPTLTDTLLPGGGGVAADEGATYQAVRDLLIQNHILNPDAAIEIFMQSTGVQSFQGLIASQVAQAILGMQFPNRVAGRAPGSNAAAAAQFGMTQQQYQLYLAAQLDRVQSQAVQRQAAQRQAAQTQAAQRQVAAKQAAQRQAAQRQVSAAAASSGGGGGGGDPSQKFTPAQRQLQQILKRERWADKLTLQKLKQYVATRKSTLQKLLQDVKKDENILNKVVVAMSYIR
jgi:hypothetical protein